MDTRANSCIEEGRHEPPPHPLRDDLGDDVEHHPRLREDEAAMTGPLQLVEQLDEEDHLAGLLEQHLVADGVEAAGRALRLHVHLQLAAGEQPATNHSVRTPRKL